MRHTPLPSQCFDGARRLLFQILALIPSCLLMMAATAGADGMSRILNLFSVRIMSTCSRRYGFRRLKLFEHIVSESNSAKYSTNGRSAETKSGFVKYDTLIRSRRKEAGRSLVVQVHSKQSCQQLYDYCAGLAPVERLFYYQLNDNSNFVLVEFQEESGRDEVMRLGCTHGGNGGTVPVTSPMVWLRGQSGSKWTGRKMSNSNTAFDFRSTSTPLVDLPLVETPPPPSQQEVFGRLAQMQSLSDQIFAIYEFWKLNETGVRLRHMTAHQLERCLSGLFPNSKALPFGSSVNGFGGAGCDLDIVFVYDDAEVSTESRLVFQSKGCGGGGIRSQTQRQMELLGDLVQVFLPGCSMVKRILQARVPIVKYTQEITGVDCDLSLTNMCAVYMSELLYLYGELDHRVRPLVFAVKQWAQACGLTSNVPGRWITNFSLALLVLFYFQRVKILPSLDALILAARPEDVKFVDDINCTFLRDVSKLCRSADDSTGSKSIAELLCGFFDFYTKFDFATAGVSICTGSSIIKPDYSPIYIVNPLERSLNVSKNVSPEEVERLRVEVRNALWCLEGGGNLPQLLLKGGTTAPPIQHHHHYQRAMKHSRMVTVKDLFTEQS